MYGLGLDGESEIDELINEQAEGRVWPTEILIKYSEDFRTARIAGEVYGLFRDNTIIPQFVLSVYNVSTGVGTSKFFFPEKLSINESKLKEILESEGIKLNEIQIMKNE